MLDPLLRDGRLWRGRPAAKPVAGQPSGHALLDAVLPSGGWPQAALIELLLPADGVGELRLLLPTLARLSSERRNTVLIAPPYLPYADGWRQAGVDLTHLQLVDADARDTLWAAEQCLRSGDVAAVLLWPRRIDDRALRRLQVAAESGRALGFVFRDQRAADNPSPAALRIAIDASPAQLRVLKCRGSNPPTRPVPFPLALPSAPH